MKQVMFALEQISKSYRGNRVLQNIKLELQPGELVLLLGANGSGKSTLLGILAGLKEADQGVRRGFEDHCAGYVGHECGLYAELSVRENLQFFLSLAGSTSSVESLANRWNLDSCADKKVRDLSAGLRARTGLCRAFAAETPLLLLDEPTANLDNDAVAVLRKELESAREREAISVLATHDLSRLKDLATRVVILSAGALVHDTGSQTQPLGSDSWEQSKRIYQEHNR